MNDIHLGRLKFTWYTKISLMIYSFSLNLDRNTFSRLVEANSRKWDLFRSDIII